MKSLFLLLILSSCATNRSIVTPENKYPIGNCYSISEEGFNRLGDHSDDWKGSLIEVISTSFRFRDYSQEYRLVNITNKNGYFDSLRWFAAEAFLDNYTKEVNCE